MDRFQPPSPLEQIEWTLCEECNSAQAEYEMKQTGRIVCADCREKLLVQKEQDANNSNT